MQDKILRLLMNTDDYISGQFISKELGVTRQAINKAVMNLRGKGYVIDSVTRKGYILRSCPNILSEEGIKSHLNTKIIGKKVKVYDSLSSTNDFLKELGSKGEPEGTVIIARNQTSGKGRMGRVWEAKKDDNVSFSIILRPQVAPMELSAITPLTGLAVCKAINEFCMLDSKIKWPNDIIADNKKLVGILTELSTEIDRIDYAVIGIGINVGNTVFPEEIAHKATSILLETGRHIDKNKFLATVLNSLEEILFKNNFRLTGETLSEYTKLCATVGRQVTFTRGNRRVSGMAVSVDNNGELEVMLSNGTVVKVNSGEVTAQGIY